MKKIIVAFLLLTLASLACTMVFDQTATEPMVLISTPVFTPQQVPTPPAQPITGIVTANFLEVRFGPGEQYPNIGLWLKKGTKVTVNYCRDDGWCRIPEGFIEQEHVKIDRSNP